MSGEAREKFSAYIKDGDMGKFASELTEKLKTDFTETMKLLRDKAFQDLPINYPRAKRNFIIGYDVRDEVTSDVMFRLGSEYQKPEDYLVSFARFVRENPEHIEAIRILLERPGEWKTGVLNELVEKLKRNHFPPDELQKAHKYVYHKALADIISMVKHAAKEEEPILTAEERVGKAMQRVMEGKSFDEDQIKWIGFIRHHLITNLTIEEHDLESFPIFADRGGLSKARKIFKNDLVPLLAEINAAIAA